ncbi:MAG: hypothetical protein IKV92_09555 [Akkermansia sp.]|nr:hypothetical protein [Akkermansia sp.]
MKESIIELTKDMSEEERNTILAELAIIAINVEGDEKAFLDCINGMTLSEVKAYSEKIKKEAKRKFDKNLYQIH